MNASKTDNLWQIHVQNRFWWDLEINKEKHLMRHKVSVSVWHISEILIHFSSDKPAVFNSQAAEILLEGLGESVIQKQKVKTFDLKHRDTQYFTLLSHLQYIWLSSVFLNKYAIIFSMRRQTCVCLMTEVWSRCANDTSTVYLFTLLPPISQNSALVYLQFGFRLIINYMQIFY